MDAGAPPPPLFLVVSVRVIVLPAAAIAGAADVNTVMSGPTRIMADLMLFASAISAFVLSASACAKM
jgi:hypothetical protein